MPSPAARQRESFKPTHALQAEYGLTEPPFVVTLPFILRGPTTREMFHPSRQERTEIRQRPCRHALHLADRVQYSADGFDILNRLEQRTGGAVGVAGGHVRFGEKVPRYGFSHRPKTAFKSVSSR